MPSSEKRERGSSQKGDSSQPLEIPAFLLVKGGTLLESLSSPPLRADPPLCLTKRIITHAIILHHVRKTHSGRGNMQLQA
jgi:hypothetical protein